jgi:hypothetical protein
MTFVIAMGANAGREMVAFGTLSAYRVQPDGRLTPEHDDLFHAGWWMPCCQCTEDPILILPTIVGSTYSCGRCGGVIDGTTLHEVKPGESIDCASCERTLAVGEKYMEDFIRGCIPCCVKDGDRFAAHNKPTT